MDMEMEGPQRDLSVDGGGKLTPNTNRISKELKVFFEEPASSSVCEVVPNTDVVRRRHSKDSPSLAGDSRKPPHPPHHDRRTSLSLSDNGAEVVRFTAKASFERKSTLLKTTVKSKLMDPR